MTTCLTIAGFDPTGSAGLLADFETFENLTVHPIAVLTAITSQTNKRVNWIHPLPPKLITEQFTALQKPAAIKIGMLANAAIIRRVAKLLPRKVPVVLDPVLRASSGRALLEPKAIPTLIETLFPLATVITPNRSEAEKLLGHKIRDLKQAALDLLELGPKAVIITGGAKQDVLADSSGVHIIKGTRTRGTSRGTGCRHSSALAAHLAKGRTIRQAAHQAQNYVRRYISE